MVGHCLQGHFRRWCALLKKGLPKQKLIRALDAKLGYDQLTRPVQATDVEDIIRHAKVSKLLFIMIRLLPTRTLLRTN